MEKALVTCYENNCLNQRLLKIRFLLILPRHPGSMGFHQMAVCELLHRNRTSPPSLWPGRELRKYHCPCRISSPPPGADLTFAPANRSDPYNHYGVPAKASFHSNVSDECIFSCKFVSGASTAYKKYSIGNNHCYRVPEGPVAGTTCTRNLIKSVLLICPDGC